MNPPVLGWAAWRVFQIDLKQRHETNPDDRHDCIAFHEYFNGDTGEGVDASHQTGWTAKAVSSSVQSVFLSSRIG